MAWCEAHSVHYVFGLARNERLEALISDANPGSFCAFDTSPVPGAQQPTYAQLETYCSRPELPIRAVAEILELGRFEARQILVHCEPVALQASVRLRRPPPTAETTSALRRTTQRLVAGDGRSATVRGEPLGPTT